MLKFQNLANIVQIRGFSCPQMLKVQILKFCSNVLSFFSAELNLNCFFPVSTRGLYFWKIARYIYI